jgi:hypothetical protein
MGRLSSPRDRWVKLAQPPKHTKRKESSTVTSQIQVFYDDETGGTASTAVYFHEDERINEGPIDTGLFDADGDRIYRIPYVDRVRLGFHLFDDPDDEYYYDDVYEEDGGEEE